MQHTFSTLGVPAHLVRNLAERNIHEPFPVQARVLPDALAGRDILAKSPTGSGKTLSFAIPIAERLDPNAGRPGALVLVPTRELATQVARELEAVAGPDGLRVAAVYGGVPLHAQSKRAQGAHILVATPGRLIDLLDRKSINLDAVRILVLDEADRMLDMGFKPQVDRIVRRLPQSRQTMFFSATLDNAVGELARAYTRDPVRCEAGLPPAHGDSNGEVEHRYVSVNADSKVDTLAELLKAESGLALVFVRTRRGADRLARKLARLDVDAVAMHGDMSQGQRERALQAVRVGPGDDARRDRRRRPRPRPRRHHPRCELRSAGGALRLRASRRPHRPRRPQRHRCHARASRPAGGREPRGAPRRAHGAVHEYRDAGRAGPPRLLVAARALEVGRSDRPPQDLARTPWGQASA